MYELIQAGDQTYYINGTVKVGIFRINQSDVCLFDTGRTLEIGRRIWKIIQNRGWNLKMILNTHAHGNHIGGNKILQEMSGCLIHTPGIGKAFAGYPVLEQVMLYGGCPPRQLKDTRMIPKASECAELVEDVLPGGVDMIRLDGHCMAHVVFRTRDDVWFLGDSVIGRDMLRKEKVPYVYDVGVYLDSLDILETLEGSLFVPSYGEPTRGIRPLVELNREKVLEIIELILRICEEPVTQEEVLRQVADYYRIVMDMQRYTVLGSTVRAYLTYLLDSGRLVAELEENRLFWRKSK